MELASDRGIHVAMANGSSLRFSFLCGLRGYHEYRAIWTPTIGEELVAKYEIHNVHDRHAIAAFKLLPGTIHPSVVGHLPREISRFTYYIIIHGGSVMPSHQCLLSSIPVGSGWFRNSRSSNH